MKCPPFDYVCPASVDEAVAALADTAGDGKILAGGQSLVPLLALRLARPTLLVDVNRISDLAGIRSDGDVVEVGALVRHSKLIEQQRHPLLSEAAKWIGHAAIRARGTSGGSIAHGDPSAELPIVALATGATIDVVGPSGHRSIAVDDLYVTVMTTTLAEDEMITNIRFPIPERWGFAEFSRRQGDFALITAVVAEVDGQVRIGLGGVGSVPRRSRNAEAAIAAGGGASEAAAEATTDITPPSDLHASTAYRRAIAAEMVRRAIVQAGIK